MTVCCQPLTPVVTSLQLMDLVAFLEEVSVSLGAWDVATRRSLEMSFLQAVLPELSCLPEKVLEPSGVPADFLVSRRDKFTAAMWDFSCCRTFLLVWGSDFRFSQSFWRVSPKGAFGGKEGTASPCVSPSTASGDPISGTGFEGP